MRIPDFTVSQFGGLNTFVKDFRTLKPGIAVDSKNWLTAKYGDHIELRRGQDLLGQTRLTGPGKVTGLGVGVGYGGKEVAFFSHGQKLSYYNDTDDNTHEVGTNLLGSKADGEDVWFSPYANLAGAMMYLGSLNSGIYKIPVANPTSAVDQGVTDFRFGFLKLGQGRSFAGNRNGLNAGNNDKTGMYLSAIDHALLSDFGGTATQTFGSNMGTTNGTSATYSSTFAPLSGYIIAPGSFKVFPNTLESFKDNGDGTLTGSSGGTGTINYTTGAVSITFAFTPASGITLTISYLQAWAIGPAGSTTYSGTLAAVAPKTYMYVNIKEIGGEFFTDDRNGDLVGNQGSTGTIDYGTGAYTLSFNHTTTGLVSATYYLEDALATVLNFDTSVLGAGKAKIFRQDDGGPFMTTIPFLDVEYAFHLLKTWALTTTLDDTSTTNLPYRNIGISYPRAAYPTPDGVLLIDTSNPSEPKVRRLEIGQNTSNLTIVPTPISDALDLSVHGFDYGVAFMWGELEIICVQEAINGALNPYNSVMYVRNTYSGAWDKLDYAASCLGILDGALIAGDPISNNVFTLFSGFDDDGSPIDNYWQDGQLNLSTDRLKRAHYMRITGLIQKDQDIDVSLVLDDGSPVTVFTIEGTGSYVDSGINTTVGSYTLGSKVIGGGGVTNAHPFDVTFPIHTDVFQHISARFQATGIGYAEIDSYEYKDIRDKGARSLSTKISQAISTAVATIWSASNYPWRDDDPWTGS